MSKITMPEKFRDLDVEEIEYDGGMDKSTETKLCFLGGVILTAAVAGIAIYATGGNFLEGVQNLFNRFNQNQFNPNDPRNIERFGQAMNDAQIEDIARVLEYNGQLP